MPNNQVLKTKHNFCYQVLFFQFHEGKKNPIQLITQIIKQMFSCRRPPHQQESQALCACWHSAIENPDSCIVKTHFKAQRNRSTCRLCVTYVKLPSGNSRKMRAWEFLCFKLVWMPYNKIQIKEMKMRRSGRSQEMASILS